MIAAELSPNYAQQYVAKPRALVESGGFDVLYPREIDERALRDDIFSYLAEYRLHVGRFDYGFIFVEDQNGMRLLDSRIGESMQEKTKKAILQKRAEGGNSTREEADDFGLNETIRNISKANVGDGTWWASLPGQDFGAYAFIYVGEIVRSIEVRDEITDEVIKIKNVEMSALRVEDPDILEFRREYQELTGQNFIARTPEDLLRRPVLILGRGKDQLETSVREQFRVSGGDDEREWIERCRIEFDRLSDDFVELVRSGAPAEQRIAVIHTMEKHADRFRKEHQKGETVLLFAYEPSLADLQYYYKDTALEHASGSCPMNNKSSNIFESKLESLNKSLFGEKYEFQEGKCVGCGADPAMIGPCGLCKPCDNRERAKNGSVLLN